MEGVSGSVAYFSSFFFFFFFLSLSLSKGGEGDVLIHSLQTQRLTCTVETSVKVRMLKLMMDKKSGDMGL